MKQILHKKLAPQQKETIFSHHRVPNGSRRISPPIS
jgi:hypothetical protein